MRERIAPLMELRKQAERRITFSGPDENFEPFEHCHLTHMVEIIQKKEEGKVFGRMKKIFNKFSIKKKPVVPNKPSTFRKA